jgi:hypothetical protein
MATLGRCGIKGCRGKGEKRLHTPPVIWVCYGCYLNLIFLGIEK